jgi:hypothetical protein
MVRMASPSSVTLLGFHRGKFGMRREIAGMFG